MVGGVSMSKKSKKRALHEALFGALCDGFLNPFVEFVKSDTSLCMEFRGDSVNIYYRGGNLIRIALQPSADAAEAHFDRNYFRTQEESETLAAVECLPRQVDSQEDVNRWLGSAPVLKQAMDRYFAEHPKEEREFQQRILRDNNCGSIARSTDYFICDIEYQHGSNSRFDMIAAHWLSTPAARKKGDERGLAFIEVKHGDDALEGSAGLRKHIRDVNEFVADARNLASLKRDMVDLFNQKRELGLVDCGKDLQSFSGEKPELILALINHDPDSSILRRVLDEPLDSSHVDLRIATASFLGYGLYDQGIHTVEEALQHFNDYIGPVRSARQTPSVA